MIEVSVGGETGVQSDSERAAATQPSARVRASNRAASDTVQVRTAAAASAPARPDRDAARVGMREHLIRITGQAVVILLAIGAWAWFASTETGRNGSIPNPLDTWRALRNLVTTSVYWTALGQTMTGYAIGLAISFVVGVPIGLAIGFWRRARQSARVLLDFVRTIPPIAIIPLALLKLGPTRRTEVVLVIIAVLPLMIVQAIYAAKEVEGAHQEVARSYRLARVERFRVVYAPSALPSLLTGLRVASTAALLVAIAAELLAAVPGLGQQLALAQQASHSPQQSAPVFAYVITSGVLGLLLNGVIMQLRKRAVWWHASVRGGQR